MSNDGRVRARRRAADATAGRRAEARVERLSELSIVNAACEIIQDVGVECLTMRRLSDELGVALGATYHHVPTRHALLRLVALQLYASVSMPPPDAGDWATRLKQLMIELSEVVKSYPGMIDFMMTTSGDEVFPKQLNREVRTLLAEAGFGERSTVTLMSLLFFYCGGMTRAMSGSPGNTAPPPKAKAVFEDGLDVLLDGARARLEADRGRRRKRT